MENIFELYGLEERIIRGDGNCQFSALSDQLFNTDKYHVQVRKRDTIVIEDEELEEGEEASGCRYCERRCFDFA